MVGKAPRNRPSPSQLVFVLAVGHRVQPSQRPQCQYTVFLKSSSSFLLFLITSQQFRSLSELRNSSARFPIIPSSFYDTLPSSLRLSDAPFQDSLYPLPVVAHQSELRRSTYYCPLEQATPLPSFISSLFPASASFSLPDTALIAALQLRSLPRVQGNLLAHTYQ